MRIVIENSPPHLKTSCYFFILHLKDRFLAYVVCSVAQSCLILPYPTDYSLPGSSVHGIFEAKLLEWVTISYSRESSQPKYQAHISCISCFGRWILHHYATWEAHIWMGIKENKRWYLAREKLMEGHCGMLPPPFNVPSCAPVEESLSIVLRLRKPLLDALHCLTFNVSSTFLSLLSSLWPLL